MKLYNTLSAEKEEFIPIEPGKVKLYTCGPTVYHYAHIGNLRTYIMEDVLEKYLRFCGFEVTRAMNITDVGHLSSDADTGEDKMLKGAKREHKSVMEIAQYYTDAFFADCEKLNIKKPEIILPATSCVDGFIEMITALIQKGYAYEAGGNIYFDTSKLKEYYVFNKQDEKDLAVGVREGVCEDCNKRSKTDFVLWFTKSKFDDQELKWDSPWGNGYPGWHIECSCISLKTLGERLDIHCGGVDNIFPHHTNEIAQSETYLGHKWCNHWFHARHLNVNSGKMSKSSGEFLTLSVLEKRNYDPLCYRFFCLLSHYRKTLEFSYEALDNAVSAFDKLICKIATLEKEGDIDKSIFDKFVAQFAEAMDNDLNTSLAITAIYDVLKSDANGSTKRALLAKFDTVLSVGLLEAADNRALSQAPCSFEADADILEQIELRAAAKKAKNFGESDRIRDALKARGILLIDTAQGTTYTKS